MEKKTIIASCVHPPLLDMNDLLCCSVLQECCSVGKNALQGLPCKSMLHVLQFVAVCGSVLQCVAVCCSVLQCGAVCCKAFPVNLCCILLQFVAVYCSVLQCVAVG